LYFTKTQNLFSPGHLISILPPPLSNEYLSVNYLAFADDVNQRILFKYIFTPLRLVLSLSLHSSPDNVDNQNNKGDNRQEMKKSPIV